MYLQTSDNVKIAYNFYEAENPAGYLVLVHMMPATKESWEDFAGLAAKRGYSSIAIDLRGHGKSDGGPNNYQNFSDEQHQQSILDIHIAVDFLKEKGVTPDKISIIGASIGANLALQFIMENPEFKTAVLLSPGLDYGGIKTEPLIKKLAVEQKVMFVTGRDDANNTEMTEQLYSVTPEKVKKNIIVYEAGGHGTNLFSTPKGPNLGEEILKFLQ